jgi:tRNA(adenine34) deaminase
MNEENLLNNDHEFFMSECIKLAMIAKQNGNSPVGSVLVQDGQIIAEGIEGGKTHNDITFHAEIEAIRRATEKFRSQDLSSCILYTTHEPCIMCSYVIRHTKFNTVVMALTTGDIGGSSSAYPLLLDKTIKKWSKPPKIITGVLEKECKNL